LSELNKAVDYKPDEVLHMDPDLREKSSPIFCITSALDSFTRCPDFNICLERFEAIMTSFQYTKLFLLSKSSKCWNYL